mgnify:CR=1 FL=1
MNILLSSRQGKWQVACAQLPKDFPEIGLRFAPSGVTRMARMHVLEVAALAIRAASLFKIRYALFGLVLVISLLVLP